MKLSLSLAFVLLTSGLADAIVPQVGDVSDRRTTGAFFNDLEVELKLQGDDVSDVKYLSVDIEEAKDDTGKDLIKTEKTMSFGGKYTEINDYNSSKNLKLNLRNPSRKAATFNVKGTISAVIPTRDPLSIVTVKNILSATGTPIQSPALKAAKIELKILTDADEKKAREEEQKKAEEAAKKQGTPPQMASMFQQMFLGDGTIKANQLRVSRSDPDGRLVSFRLLKANGNEIRSNGWSGQEESRVYSYGEDIPQDATLEIVVATDKSIEKVPFTFSNVYLP